MVYGAQESYVRVLKVLVPEGVGIALPIVVGRAVLLLLPADLVPLLFEFPEPPDPFPCFAFRAATDAAVLRGTLMTVAAALPAETPVLYGCTPDTAGKTVPEGTVAKEVGMAWNPPTLRTSCPFEA